MTTIINSPAGFFWSDAVTPDSATDLQSVLDGLETSGAAAAAAATAAAASATSANTAATAASSAASAAVSTVNDAVTSAEATINASVTSATTTLSAAASEASSAASAASSSASSASSSATAAASSATSAGTSATNAAASATAASGSATSAATSATNAATSAASVAAIVSGGTLTVPNVTTSLLASSAPTSSVVIKNGPSGNILATIGGSGNDIALRGNLTLPGGAFGGSEGHLYAGVAPIFQNAAFTGSSTNPAAAFGAFLQQSDNSSNTACGVGFLEHLTLSGSNVVGGRTAGQFNLDINATTGNATQQMYVGLGSKCNLNATDASGTSSAFGANPVASIGPGVTAAQCVGTEVNTWIQSGATVNDRIGIQIVDVLGTTYGVQAVRDDMGYALTNQYAPSSTRGFKVGFSFGRAGGFFPVATNGTIIGGQGNVGGTWTVAKGIDWSLGTATSYWLKFGSLTLLDGSGNLNATTVKSNGGIAAFGATPPASKPTITGSRSGATASVLAQVLTALAGAGLITDSTTA